VATDETAEEPLPKRQHLDTDRGDDGSDEFVLERLQNKTITLGTIQRRLEAHVDQYDASQALEYVTRQGRIGNSAKPLPLFIAPRRPTMAHDVITLAHPSVEWVLLEDACHMDSRVKLDS
jgi:hypothetical protein